MNAASDNKTINPDELATNITVLHSWLLSYDIVAPETETEIRKTTYF